MAFLNFIIYISFIFDLKITASFGQCLYSKNSFKINFNLFKEYFVIISIEYIAFCFSLCVMTKKNSFVKYEARKLVIYSSLWST